MERVVTVVLNKRYIWNSIKEVIEHLIPLSNSPQIPSVNMLYCNKNFPVSHEILDVRKLKRANKNKCRPNILEKRTTLSILLTCKIHHRKYKNFQHSSFVYISRIINSLTRTAWCSKCPPRCRAHDLTRAWSLSLWSNFYHSSTRRALSWLMSMPVW